MTAVKMNNSCEGWCNSVVATFSGVVDFAGKAIISLGRDLADVKIISIHLKAFDATLSLWNTFGGREITKTEENTRSTFKGLKGWNAIGTITGEVQKLADKAELVVKQTTPRVVADFIATTTGVMGKAYEITAFLGNDLALSFFKKIAETYKTTNMQALVVGSSIRGFFCGEKVVAYLQGSGDWKSGSQDLCDLVANIGALSLSISALGGFGSRYIVASSAVSAFSQSFKYFIGKL